MRTATLSSKEIAVKGPADAQPCETDNLQPRTAGPAILVAHPDAQTRAWISGLLLSNKYGVTACDNGQEALRLFTLKPYALVLAAVSMPRIDGLEFLRAVRAQSPNLPVIALSGADSIEQVYLRSAAALGATLTYTLPLSSEDLLEGVDAAIHGNRKNQSG